MDTASSSVSENVNVTVNVCLGTENISSVILIRQRKQSWGLEGTPDSGNTSDPTVIYLIRRGIFRKQKLLRP